ncbi:MAG: hypothetical protein IPO87_12600 [Flavobacteriales bacterium]|nr:hypothetical protein [Flavobacteriales bacterium]
MEQRRIGEDRQHISRYDITTQSRDKALDFTQATDLIVDQDKVIVISELGIWQARINPSGELVHVGSVDFPSRGVVFEKSHGMLFSGASEYRSILLRSEPNSVYVLSNPTELIVPKVPEGYNLIGYNDSLKCYGASSYDGRWYYPKGMTAGIDGTHRVEYDLIYMQWNKPDELLVVKEDHPGSKVDLTQVDLIGNTHWTYRTRAGGKFRFIHLWMGKIADGGVDHDQ